MMFNYPLGFVFLNCLTAIVLFTEVNSASCSQEILGGANEPKSKLLIILIDGFRWDYYSRQKFQLPGLTQLISTGIQTQWVEPIFPSLSFPSWTTIATGLYVENHNIFGNYMIRLKDDENPETLFDLMDKSSTMLPLWWKYAEPIWITATKAGKKVSLANWGRCEVPYDGVLPAECVGYTYQAVNRRFRDDLNTAVKRLNNGFSLAMVYDDFIDHVGHQYGPDSYELQIALIQRDSYIKELLFNIKMAGLTNKVNIVVISDHGMTNTKKESGEKFIKLSDYINEEDVYKVVDYGAIVSIVAEPNRSESLYGDLSKLPGINVYRKGEIPEKFHFDSKKWTYDFLLVAELGFAIVSLKGDKQFPNDSKASAVNPYDGSHGYYNTSDMNTIFFATGPAFKKNTVHPPIGLQDEYQIFMEILQLSALPNNGSWDNVKNIFRK